MCRIFYVWLVTASLGIPISARADDADITKLKQELHQLKLAYEKRLQQLETRLAQLDRKTAQATIASSQAAPARGNSNSFNPAINVVLNGKYQEFSRGSRDFTIPGFAVNEEAGPGTEGFSLGESEINLNANIDDKFYGSLTFALVDEEGEDKVEIEEAYLKTLALPAGMGLRAGRFFSRIGYLNETHSHTDDFADRPLPYRAMLGNQYGDDGAQLTWTAPAEDIWLEFGAEIFRGAKYPSGGSRHDGKGAHSFFAHIGGDVGESHSWRAGAARLSTTVSDRASGEPDAADLFSGDSNLWLVDFVWKWAPHGNPTLTNFKLQGEYFRRDEDGVFTPNGGAATNYQGGQKGWYLQGVYQFMPHWRVGLRHARLAADDVTPALAGTALDNQNHTPRHSSLMVDWSNSEFSRLRLQYNHDASQPGTDNQWLLQYIMTFGSHGGHTF